MTRFSLAWMWISLMGTNSEAHVLIENASRKAGGIPSIFD